MKKKIEIFIENEENTWLSFHVFKYWFKISENHTTELVLVHVCTPLWVDVSLYITIRYAKPVKCVLQQNVMALFSEHFLYKYKKCNDTWFLQLFWKIVLSRNGHNNIFSLTCSSRMFPLSLQVVKFMCSPFQTGRDFVAAWLNRIW